MLNIAKDVKNVSKIYNSICNSFLHSCTTYVYKQNMLYCMRQKTFQTLDRLQTHFSSLHKIHMSTS